MATKIELTEEMMETLSTNSFEICSWSDNYSSYSLTEYVSVYKNTLYSVYAGDLEAVPEWLTAENLDASHTEFRDPDADEYDRGERNLFFGIKEMTKEDVQVIIDEQEEFIPIDTYEFLVTWNSKN